MPASQLPFEIRKALKDTDIAECKRLFSECEPNATVYEGHGLNIFSLVPMPREFALWAQEQGADINFRDTDGQTPVFEIARRDGDLPLLIELGAEVKIARPDGWTPLHVAAARGNKKAVRTLLKAGADIHARTAGRDNFGFFTPVELVLCEQDLSCSKKYELCKLLLDKGAAASDRCRLYFYIREGFGMPRVRLTVTRSECRCGYHKAGEVFLVDDLCPPLCHELWNSIYPYIYALQNGAELDCGSARAKAFDAKCPDGGRVWIHGEVVEM